MSKWMLLLIVPCIAYTASAQISPEKWPKPGEKWLGVYDECEMNYPDPRSSTGDPTKSYATPTPSTGGGSNQPADPVCECKFDSGTKTVCEMIEAQTGGLPYDCKYGGRNGSPPRPQQLNRTCLRKERHFDCKPTRDRGSVTAPVCEIAVDGTAPAPGGGSWTRVGKATASATCSTETKTIDAETTCERNEDQCEKYIRWNYRATPARCQLDRPCWRYASTESIELQCEVKYVVGEEEDALKEQLKTQYSCDKKPYRSTFAHGVQFFQNCQLSVVGERCDGNCMLEIQDANNGCKSTMWQGECERCTTGN